MTTLNKSTVNELASDEMYSYSTISDFGWASHLNVSEGGLVVNFKNNTGALVYEINNKLILQDEDDLSDNELNDVRDLIEWIEA